MKQQIELSDGWRVRQILAEGADIDALTRSALDPDADWLPTRVPAQVHEILLASGRIPDPHIGKNAAECAWVGEADWVYATRFPSPGADGPVDGPVFLCMDGLDTLAAVYLNGQEVGRFENMHRQYRLDVAAALKPAGGENVLLIIFSSAARFIRQAEAQWGPQEGIPSFRYLRKCASDFTSYMGARPNFINVGIYDRVYLEVPDRAWLEDAWVRPALLDGLARARVVVALELGGEAGTAAWRVADPDGREVLSGVLTPGQSEFEFFLENPRLWWPVTHGEPALYRLRVDVLAAGEIRDSREIAFGLREIKPVLKEAQTGEDRFAFEINGQRIFLRGACWAPLEGMTHVWDPERAERLLDLVEQGHMNVLRVWGEGLVPNPSFYAECDRRGILVWQDFMFGYGKHPSGAPGFAESVRLELEDIVRRLRNHPSLLLWCGGNENYMGWDFQFHRPAADGWEIFTQVMPEVLAGFDPDRLFQRSSPFGGAPAPNWPLEGDWHDYTTVTFSPAASVPLFASEIGRVSAPSITSMRRFMSAEELWPAGFDARIRKPGQKAWPPMWEYRASDGAWSKIGAIEAYCDPTTPEELIRVLGTAHGEYLQARVERERRGAPDGQADGVRRCWGNTIWRLNDSWPILYWSAVDYYLEPKIPYYFLKRAYRPVLVCFEQTADRICAWVVNDSPDPVSGPLVVRRMSFGGEVLGELQTEIHLVPGVAKRCLDLTPFGPISLYDDFLAVEFCGGIHTHLLKAERYLHLPEAHLGVKWVGNALELSSDVFARQVTLEIPDCSGAVFEDNFFDLVPGQKKQVRILNPAGGERVRARAVNAGVVDLALSGSDG